MAACVLMSAEAVSSAPATDFTDLSLEQLMRVEITSAAKRPATVLDTPAAAFVLTNEDIHRSGARSIPEVLRLVPGLNVARTSSSGWAISARGDNGLFANKLLVLVDGRSVYTPLFSGVFWDRHDTLLEDVERIEVIRGPGASLWGANAVNGVINIITKNAEDTQGTYLSAGYGTGDEKEAEARYGGELGEYGHYRIYGKGFEQGGQEAHDGGEGADDWRSARAGFRMDVTGANGDAWQLQGGSFGNDVGNKATLPTFDAPYSTMGTLDSEITGGYALGTWSRDISSTNRVEVRSYVQRTVFEDDRLDEERNTFDIEADHNFTYADRHQIVWGMGARYSHDNIRETDQYGWGDNDDDQYLINGFFQDTIGFWDDEVQITLGSKIEYNNYTGFEIQPSARALWHVNNRHTVWGAVSRAVRTPSRAEDDIDLLVSVSPAAGISPFGTETRLVGDSALQSEELLSFEAGHRWQFSSSLSFDLAAYYNFYDRRVSAAVGDTYFVTRSGGTNLVLPLVVNNDGEAETYGFELLANWQPREDLRLQGWYSLLEHSEDPAGDPNHQASLRVSYDLSETVVLDGFGRYVGELGDGAVSAYGELGARVAWFPRPYLELALVGQNLVRDNHLEFGSDSVTGTQSTRIERSVFGSVTLRF
ncbi:TonB-dependent receptor plug domain-containing protein [Nisaea sp.]|uniref:TonB-dependent receptor plug domain-containing protein n=1 Tax=Nisaea sp. TaxID=2024842 RepID=UPI003B52CD8B